MVNVVECPQDQSGIMITIHKYMISINIKCDAIRIHYSVLWMWHSWNVYPNIFFILSWQSLFLMINLAWKVGNVPTFHSVWHDCLNPYTVHVQINKRIISPFSSYHISTISAARTQLMKAKSSLNSGLRLTFDKFDK